MTATDQLDKFSWHFITYYFIVPSRHIIETDMSAWDKEKISHEINKINGDLVNAKALIQNVQLQHNCKKLFGSSGTVAYIPYLMVMKNVMLAVRDLAPTVYLTVMNNSVR